MKIFNTLTIGLFLLAGFASCEMKEEILGEKESPTDVGYLELETAIQEKGDAVETKATQYVEGYPILIIAESGEIAAELESGSGYVKQKLPVGKYTIIAHTPGEMASIMSEPYYKGETGIEIIKDRTSSKVLTCTMQNTQIRINYSPAFVAGYKEWDLTFQAGDSNILSYDETDKDPVDKYWAIGEEVKSIYVHLSYTTIEGVQNKQDMVITKPEGSASEFWQGGDLLSVNLEPGTDDPENPNGASIVLKVDVSFYEAGEEEEIEVPVEDVTDPEPVGDPSVSFPKSSYSLPAELSAQADAAISAPAGLESVKVNIVAGNEMFAGIVQDMFGGAFELIGNTELESVFTGLGISLPEKGAVNYNFPVHKFFSLLQPMGATSGAGHVFEISVTDKNGKTHSGSLSVIVTE